MRVLFFSRAYTTHDRRFLASLSGGEDELWFLPLEDDGNRYEARPLPPGVRTPDWRLVEGRVREPEECLRLMPRFEKVLAAIRPDLVHAGPVQTCGFIAALSGFRPLMVMSWGSDLLMDAWRDERWTWTTRFTLRAADAFVCDCDAVRVQADRLTDGRAMSVVQFPWGVDLARYHPGAVTAKPWADRFPASAVVVLSTRSWERGYGIDVLLDAFRRAHGACPDLRLALLGGGSLAPMVEEHIGRWALDDLVYRPGVISQDTLPEWFRAADVYLSCTESDGSSISLLEAMASGLPVVVTDCPGNREWVEPGANGWLSPASDPARFAEGLLAAVRLADEPRAALRRANRRVAEQRADWNRNIERLRTEYGRLGQRERRT